MKKVIVAVHKFQEKEEGKETNYFSSKFILRSMKWKIFSDYFTDSREYSTIRECAKWRNAERECYRGRYSADSYQLTCECKGSGCNRSANLKPHLCYLYILSQLLVLLYTYYITFDAWKSSNHKSTDISYWVEIVMFLNHEHCNRVDYYSYLSNVNVWISIFFHLNSSNIVNYN